jgi:hypothetical protein
VVFPTYGAISTGRDFGLDYDYEVNYRDLRERFATEATGNWVLLPPIPYNALENCYPGEIFRPAPPNGPRATTSVPTKSTAISSPASSTASATRLSLPPASSRSLT